MQEGKRLRTTILALAWTALTAVFALGTPATAAAQGTATIRGTVTDASGGVLPGATVTITNSGTKDTRSAVTDDRGGYTFASLFNGTYEVKVELEGFKGYDAKNIVLSPNDTRGLDVMLEVGSLTDVVTVTTPLEIVQTETGAREGVLRAEQIENLSVLGPQLARTAAHPARRRRPGQHRVRERQLRRRREQHAGLHGQRHPLLGQHGQPGRLGPHRHRVEQRRHRDAEQRHGAGGQGPELELRRRARRGRHERERGDQVRQLAVPRLGLLATTAIRSSRPTTARTASPASTSRRASSTTTAATSAVRSCSPASTRTAARCSSSRAWKSQRQQVDPGARFGVVPTLKQRNGDFSRAPDVERPEPPPERSARSTSPAGSPARAPRRPATTCRRTSRR